MVVIALKTYVISILNSVDKGLSIDSNIELPRDISPLILILCH